jgi:glycosyltransferase involved in cell wall biosynthesis
MLLSEHGRFRDFVRRESPRYDLVIVHDLLETVPRQFLLHLPKGGARRLLSLQYGISTAEYSTGLSLASWLLHKSMGKLLISRVENILVFSSGTISELREYFGPLRGKNVHQLDLGIDAVSFEGECATVMGQLPAVAQWLDGRSIRPPFIFAIGRNNRAKGFDLLLESFSQLTAEFPGLTLVLAGERTPFTDELERTIRERKLQDRVSVLGRISSWERMALLATSAVFVIPSRKEGYGLNAVHARILSKPTVATSTGAHEQILGHEGPFALVRPGDVSQLTQALRVFITSAPGMVSVDPDQLARFDIGLLAKELLQLLPSRSTPKP